eukprot:1159394-Pelagomonas_calceolata.AAC.14
MLHAHPHRRSYPVILFTGYALAHCVKHLLQGVGGRPLLIAEAQEKGGTCGLDEGPGCIEIQEQSMREGKFCPQVMKEKDLRRRPNQAGANQMLRTWVL